MFLTKDWAKGKESAEKASSAMVANFFQK